MHLKDERMDKNTNQWLMLGVTILIMGLLLLSYSVSTYNESKNLAQKIDFEEIDNNNQMSTSDKYYKYLSNADYLNENLKKNKNILIKNSSCIYLDYAQHNAISLYRLAYNGFQTEESRKSVAAGNVRALYNMLDNYKTCNQTQKYKEELKDILDDIQKSDELYSSREERMRSFMDGYSKESALQEPVSENSEEQVEIAPDGVSVNNSFNNVEAAEQDLYPEQLH